MTTIERRDVLLLLLGLQDDVLSTSNNLSNQCDSNTRYAIASVHCIDIVCSISTFLCIHLYLFTSTLTTIIKRKDYILYFCEFNNYFAIRKLHSFIGRKDLNMSTRMTSGQDASLLYTITMVYPRLCSR